MLFFGRRRQGLLGADAALTVITMAGLRLPDLKIEREYWSAEESLALPMLHTAHRLAVRRCYGGSMSSRKLVGLDEAHFMEGWRSGRSFLVRLARDSRKWNLAALVASQNPRDILGLDVQNLVSTVFVGRIAEDAEIASEALRLLRVPVDDGYEATLASLSAGRHLLVHPARLPRVRDARRGRAGAEGPGRRLVRRRAAGPPRHHPGGRQGGTDGPAACRLSDLEDVTWRGRASARRSCSRSAYWSVAIDRLAADRRGGRRRPPRAPVGPGAAPALLQHRGVAGRTSRPASAGSQDVSAGPRSQCLNAPTPGTPDSGLAGWFADRPDSSTEPGPQGLYSQYGYAGYSYTTYDIDGGCASTR